MSTVKEETTTVKINLNSGTNYKIFIRGVAGKDSQGVYVNEVLYKIPNNNILVGWNMILNLKKRQTKLLSKIMVDLM